MSAGHPHRRPNLKHPRELPRLLQDGGAPELMARWRQLDDRWDMPYLAGYNNAGTVRYIDRDAMRALLDPAFAKEIGVGPIDTGLSREDTIECLMDHEAVEKVLLDADIAETDTYLPAHEFATHAEHNKVKAKGGTIIKYERGLVKLIKYCLHKTPQSVPQDLSCAAFLDAPDKHEKKIIDIFKSLGVVDAFKRSKCDVDYSEAVGEDQCQHCANWRDDPEQAPFSLGRCNEVEGLVRTTPWCRKYKSRRISDGEEADSKLSPGQTMLTSAHILGYWRLAVAGLVGFVIGVGLIILWPSSETYDECGIHTLNAPGCRCRSR